MKKLVLLNISGLFIIIIVVELLLGSWFKDSLDCRYLHCNAKYNFNHRLFGYKYLANYTSDKYGLRGNHSNPNQINILVVGGSTTDQRYIDDKDTWDALLEKKVAKKKGSSFFIANAGLTGQSTTGHIWNFENWFNKIPNLKPDYIFFYIGLNDVIPKADSGRYDNIRKNYIDNIYSVFFNNSAIYFLFRNIKGIILAYKFDAIGVDRTTGNLKYSNIIQSPNWESYNSEINLALYEDYLENIFFKKIKILINKTEKMGAEPIFITQRSAKWKYLSNKIAVLPKKITFTWKGNLYEWTSKDYAYAEYLISKKLIKYCKDYNLKCFNGHSNLDINDKNTYDYIHAMPNGSTEIANKMFKFMEEQNLF